MSVPQFRFRLTHQYPEGATEFTNNEFQVSLSGWEQYVFSGTQVFVWSSGTARADGSVSNLPSTAAIGQAGPSLTDNKWHQGEYSIDIVAKNNSAGGSAPFQSILSVWASNSTASIQESVSYTGIGTWDVVPVSDDYTNNRIKFTLDQDWNYIFFSFSKVGPTSGYEVDFKIDSINIITLPKSQLISEPDGWSKAVLRLERHEEFHSLVLHFEGDFIFYGSDGQTDGGVNFIKAAEYLYGADTKINIEIDISVGGSFDRLFSGQLDLSLSQELLNNKMEIPIIRNDFWSKFISRKDTPVNLRAERDIDGGIVPIIDLIDIQLTGQAIRYNGYYRWKQSFSYVREEGLHDFQFDWDDLVIDDLKKLNIPRVKVGFTSLGDGWSRTNAFPQIEAPWDGTYTFECRLEMARYDSGGNVWNAGNINVWIQKYGAHPSTHVQFTEALETYGSDTIRIYTVTQSFVLKKGEQVIIYGTDTLLGDNDTVFGWDLSDTEGNDLQFRPYPGPGEPNTYLRVTADTTFPDSNCQAYFLHDAGNAITDRIIGRPNTFYSEHLGGISTNGRSYDSNGCAWSFAVTPGLQVRGFPFDQKQFSMSLMQWWKGANPEFNLGLGYTTIDGVEVIEVEPKGNFYDRSSVSITINNAFLTREYDNERIFNKIIIGNQKWQSEDTSGLDDPQTKHTYAVPFVKVGKEVSIMSDFIAASNAIEVTRRQSIDQSKDYKFDNDVFIISLNTDSVSPDRYRPELDENYNSISGINNASTRYNFILTPLRKLLRWGNYLGGCLQKNTNNLPYKFVSGEGNYDMVTDHNCASGQQCLAVICGESLSEKQDIRLGAPDNYNSTIGYLHFPDLYRMEINLTYEDYKSIENNRKLAIAVSQTETNHKKFFIKDLKYEICEGRATIMMWAAEEFQLTVPESVQVMDPCGLEPHEPIEGCLGDFSMFDPDYEAVLLYACSQGFTIPSVCQQRLQNQLVLDLKEQGFWSRLDLFYVLNTDGDENFASINWKSPGEFQLVKQGNVTFTPNEGVQGDGSTGYYETNFVPSTDADHYAQGNAGLFCSILNDVASNSMVAFGSGGGGSDPSILFRPRSTGDFHFLRINDPTGESVGTGVTADGFYHLERFGSASGEAALYKNGSQVGSNLTAVANGVPAYGVHLLAFNLAGFPFLFSTHKLEMFALGESCSTLNHSGFYDAWTAYQQNVSCCYDPSPCNCSDFSLYDPDYIAILEYACSQGFQIPSVEQQVLQSELVGDLKGIGVWDRSDVIYVFATDGDDDFSLINWKSPGNFSCTKINAPTRIENVGWVGNGVDSCLSTNWDMATNGVNYTANDAGALCYVNNNPASANAAAFGVRNIVTAQVRQTLLMPNNLSNAHAYCLNSTSIDTGSSVDGDGFYHIERDSSTSQRLFKNGVQVGSDDSTVVESNLAQIDVYVCAANSGVGMSSNVGFPSTYEIGFFAIGAAMSDLNPLQPPTVWNNYFQNL